MQQQRPQSLTVTLTWHACKYKVHELHWRYIPFKKKIVSYFKRFLTPLWVDSARALWASFCFRSVQYIPVNMPDPIWISLEVLARSRPDDSCTPACFQTGSVWPKLDSQPEPDWIQAGFAQYDPGCLWKNATKSESGKLVAGCCVLPEPGPMILSHQIASGPDAFGQNLTRPSRSDPGQFCAL